MKRYKLKRCNCTNMQSIKAYVLWRILTLGVGKIEPNLVLAIMIFQTRTAFRLLNTFQGLSSAAVQQY